MQCSRLTWLDRPPKIRLLKVTDSRKPYPLSWEEQARLFRELPDHLARMALFKVNTGCREQEVCSLRWAGSKRGAQVRGLAGNPERGARRDYLKQP